MVEVNPEVLEKLKRIKLIQLFDYLVLEAIRKRYENGEKEILVKDLASELKTESREIVQTLKKLIKEGLLKVEITYKHNDIKKGAKRIKIVELKNYHTIIVRKEYAKIYIE